MGTSLALGLGHTRKALPTSRSPPPPGVAGQPEDGTVLLYRQYNHEPLASLGAMGTPPEPPTHLSASPVVTRERSDSLGPQSDPSV